MNLDTILTSSEGKTLEFKRDISSLKPIIKTIVAFANTAGGVIVIGRDDNGNIVGVDDPLLAEEQLASSIADSISPRLIPNIEMATVDGRTLLLIEVYVSGSRPHYVRNIGPNNGVFVRLGSTNRQADRELTEEIRRGVAGGTFDSEPMTDLSIDDIDLVAAQRAFGNTRQINEQTLQSLRIVTQEQGRLVPTRGGVLLFGKNREYHYPDAWIQCGRFIGKDKADIFDHIELYDHLPQALDSIILFLRKHAMRGADFSEVRRKDVWSVPLGILREAVINALVHTDYSQRGAPIRIAFFDDRIEIENPGILLPGMTIEDIKQGVSKTRNPVIARTFRELDLIEQWGSGIRRIFKEAEKLGLPELQIVEIGMRFRFIIPLADQHVVKPVVKNAEAQVEVQVEAQVEREILEVCFEQPLSSSEIAAALGHKKLSGNLRKALPRLKQAGLIEYTIPGKPKSRNQKYRLTELGNRILRGDL